MELLKYLRYEMNKNGNKVNIGLFLCPYCLQEVERQLSAGKKQKSCGCVSNKLKSEAKKGIKKSKEHRQKISETRIKKEIAKGEKNPFYGKKHTEESRRKIKNKEITEECRQKISEGVKKKWQDTEYIEKQRSRTGEKSSNWQGGISFAIRGYGIEFNKQLKQQILERDNYVCQNSQCNIEITNYRGLDIHHIDYDKKNNNSENLITLCKNCHAKTFGKNNREYWIKHYQQLL